MLFFYHLFNISFMFTNSSIIIPYKFYFFSKYILNHAFAANVKRSKSETIKLSVNWFDGTMSAILTMTKYITCLNSQFIIILINNFITD